MSEKLYVRLCEEDHASLEKMTRSGSGKAREITRTRIVLLADRNQQSWKTQAQIAEVVGVSPVTVSRICRRFVLEGKQQAIQEKSRPGQAPKITGDVEAQLLAIACSKPPLGKARWTMRMLRDELIRLEMVEDISHVAVHQALKKTRSSLGK